MGLTTNDGTHRVTFDAFRTMSAELGGCTNVEQIAGADHPTVGVQVYRLHDGNGVKLVAWNIDGTSAVRLTAADIEHVSIVDVVGKPVPTAKAADGSIPLTLNQSPIYIGTADASARLDLVSAPGLEPTYLFP